MSDHNRFEVFRDRLSQRMTEHRAAAYKAFGVGERPYGTVRVSDSELLEWYENEKAGAMANGNPLDGLLALQNKVKALTPETQDDIRRLTEGKARDGLSS